MAEPSYFDAQRDVSPLRRSFFSPLSGPEPMNEPDGYTGFQRRYLTDAFMTQVVPIQKELESLEERRKLSRLNDIRLEEQTLQLETLREQTKNNRDILTRLPFLTQELDSIVSGSDEDPVAAASSLAQLAIKNAELLAGNAAARVMHDASQQKINLKVNERRAADAVTLERGSKFAVMADPGLSARGEELLAGLGTPEAALALDDARVIREAAERDLELQADKGAIAASLQYLDEAQKALEGIKSDPVDSTDYTTGVVTKSYVYSPEVKSLLERLSANLLPGAAPETDVLKRQNQLLAVVQQQKALLLSAQKGSKATSATPSTMRGLTTKP